MDQSEAGKKGYKKTKKQLEAYLQKKREDAIERYESNPKFCLTCDEQIPYEKRRNKFCSKSCAATYNNQGVVRVETVNPEECAHCGAIKEKRHNKYCDACIEAKVYNIPQSLDNIISQEGVRSYLLRTREYKCENCGIDTWLGDPAPLEAHHIDGNPDNNTEENLQLLCCNCHVMTDNHSGAAKGNAGRDSRRRRNRRQRYKDGKTW